MTQFQTTKRNRYVYGPVRSWRSGTSLGIDPIGDISTCSFNCAYCQLGKIQKITTEIKTYVETALVIEDLQELEKSGAFKYEDLDVITFAGSGEPSLAENLGEMISAIRNLYADRARQVPISILTNATMLNDKDVRARLLLADQISLKLDAVNNEMLRSINQPAPGISLETIVEGIKLLRLEMEAGSLRPFRAQDDALRRSYAAPQDDVPQLQLQIMLMPKWVIETAQGDPHAPSGLRMTYLNDLAKIISELGINRIQINTPTRPKPVSKTGEYWIDTRGNHYGPGEADEVKPKYIEFTELPVISREDAFRVEDELRRLTQDTLPDLEVINVYKRSN